MCQCTSDEKDCSICTVDLYKNILVEECSCLNEEVSKSFRSVLKPNRNLPSVSGKCSSDSDGELIFKIAFDGSVQITHIFIQTSKVTDLERILAFTSNPFQIDFNSVLREKYQQIWDDRALKNCITQEYEDDTTILYKLETNLLKFSNLSSIALYVKSKNQPLEIHHLGFVGEFKYSRKNPIVTSYEILPSITTSTENLIKNEF